MAWPYLTGVRCLTCAFSTAAWRVPEQHRRIEKSEVARALWTVTFFQRLSSSILILIFWDKNIIMLKYVFLHYILLHLETSVGNWICNFCSLDNIVNDRLTYVGHMGENVPNTSRCACPAYRVCAVRKVCYQHMKWACTCSGSVANALPLWRPRAMEESK